MIFMSVMQAGLWHRSIRIHHPAMDRLATAKRANRVSRQPRHIGRGSNSAHSTTPTIAGIVHLALTLV
jgi:hypothetical protein